MEFRTLLTKPKIMALSGLITMGCKLAIAGILAIVLNLCITNEFFFWMFISYPIVGLVVDIALYINKDKIWTTLADNIPSEWESTPEQLLAYTKNLPKIRLMRFLTCWVLIPIVTSDNSKGGLLLVESLNGIAIGFFICSLFDMVWVNIFKLKQPALIRNTVEQQKNLARWNKQLDDDFNSRMQLQYARDRNAGISGTSAWFAQQHIDSL